MTPQLIALAHSGRSGAGPAEGAAGERGAFLGDLYRLGWKAWGPGWGHPSPGLCRVQLGTCMWPCLSAEGCLEMLPLGRRRRPPCGSRVKLLAVPTPLRGILTLPTGALGLQGKLAKPEPAALGSGEAWFLLPGVERARHQGAPRASCRSCASVRATALQKVGCWDLASPRGPLPSAHSL